MNLATNLDTAEKGQAVEVYRGGFYSTSTLAVITHATRTKLVVEGIDYNRAGYRRGTSGYGSSRIRALTAERVEEIKAEAVRRKAVLRLKNITWDNLTDQQLAAVVAALPPTP